jgi:hypothetical protein
MQSIGNLGREDFYGFVIGTIDGDRGTENCAEFYSMSKGHKAKKGDGFYLL